MRLPYLCILVFTFLLRAIPCPSPDECSFVEERLRENVKAFAVERVSLTVATRTGRPLQPVLVPE